MKRPSGLNRRRSAAERMRIVSGMEEGKGQRVGARSKRFALEPTSTMMRDEPSEPAWIATKRRRAAWLWRSVRRLSNGANLHDIRVCDVLSGDEQNGQSGEGWMCIFMRHPPRKRRAALNVVRLLVRKRWEKVE